MKTLYEKHDDHAALAARLAEQGVQFAMAAWVDVNGKPKSKVVPIKHLPDMLAGSERYTPRGIGGLGAMNPAEDECVGLPDPDTLRILSWDPRIAYFNADLVRGETREPWENCPRSALKKVVAKAADMGFAMNLGVETEFYVYRTSALPDLVPRFSSSIIEPTPAYDARSVIDSLEFFAELAQHMDASGYGLYSFDQEGGEGQYELDFSYTDVLGMCDRLTHLRLMLAALAQKIDATVTFMPRPETGAWGSGAHMNMSLVSTDTGENVFVEADGGWSKTALSFAAGVLRHASALTALTCPTVNSYKRLTPKLKDGSVSWAPVWARYGTNNRSCMLRLPGNRPCIENRAVDMTANMYLAAAFTLAAGLEGIELGLHPGDPVADDTSDWNRFAPAEDRLPRTLLEAIEAFAADPLVAETFSAGFIRDYIAMKTEEWDSYHSVVTQWEVDRYLLDV
ncbi:MAG: glutamate--ammonia ligase [Mycolicibacterium hassiacum]|jgi:glutamine synthetase|uniref:glutamine synthetase family protein n=1 Tax=Mycolicibacterium hassiacum TaxID=46351 RepID=UPI0023F715BA|nr:glutamate--ammonia ligase [Mycolicibacterium hassiacum]MBX5486847.1 glutamate--ammonia ligase [Mycolicibacterium hassiacum]